MNNRQPKTRIQQKNTLVILEAALDVFSQFGFRGSTLDQIAKTAGMSKPNLLYYFASKEAIHTVLLEGLLETWLEPLHKLDAAGNPRAEILAYVHRKLQMSRDFPRESRLFANEILQGAPRIGPAIEGELKKLVEEKSIVIDRWITEGKIAPVDPRHLLFSIWSLTQHYADFDVQVRMVLGEERPDPFPDAEAFLDTIFTRILAPDQK
ncbi:TetR family transcriptional regulator C-terminal domain-containing protein [Falsihalocynthiibacter arcticus]|uniref:TetR family transcriptional regulator n=1 Tax=Falsihalocynthiibacter arcticus TaxID=1579316 RepID=A0A126V561_9RHOB|nr:TetR family transcriptional regulator C-terminal domain-containing protein [Falsihalocynthiibacter arcticus]AML53440.1 TetR family transcriptional regulator [Falsihalocynthiibacter arcticus]